MAAQGETRNRLLAVFTDQLGPDTEVDYVKLGEAFGLSSMQQLALLKAINEEFGTNITLGDLSEAGGKISELLP